MPQTRSIQPAVLLLDDGTVYHGKAFGKIGTAAGELCFNTGMTGYQEVFTDPSYKGQVLIMNNCYVGNYGVKKDDVESDSVKISGLICKNISYNYSRQMADGSLEKFLDENNLVAIHDVDTRALVAHIRSKGAMNCIISSEILDVEQLKGKLKQVPSMEGLALCAEVSTKEAYNVGNPDAEIRIAVLDNGVKRNMLKCLSEKGAYLQVFPTDTPFEECEKFKPHAYFVSNGPGDPAPLKYAVDTVKQILNANKPMFGICLGHQLLALANDIPTYKMHHGHRGLNHPVKNLATGRCEITTQNHGFAVDPKAIAASETVEVTHVNLNDASIEGIRIKNKPAFSVQYHPESTPGPYDSRYLFDDFFNMIKANM
ncbi:glutamine-hydrolyzing carbamoyl-phosphate synthase small subunit [Chitinophaga agri]|uniref:Carbamoyl phosphate synthase small chain n=1 Tax=Chitinophaga agri TaxID=2703787 RepID=A0A6B9ZKY5_9BACT|nr:glutamine-hydrolyzing carbamoyl-phosphate synthase small subunit [Chitinophaga agri]QHS62469.1 glutamine-hydrolyzing carbamoyl-phosphate synthase small subunit [Chitinophaga agri]